MPIGSGLCRWSVVIASINLSVGLVNTRRFIPLVRHGAAVVDPVVVCVPARDEADRISALIGDLRSQREVTDLRVLIYDDCSTDDTADRAHAAIDDDPRLTVVSGLPTPPPAGWTGKAWALHRLTTMLDDDCHLCFVDADVRLGPDAIARAVRTFRTVDASPAHGSLGLLSVWPQEIAGSAVEVLVQPLLSWSWFALLPLALTERQLRPSTALANGQFLMTVRSRHVGVGGHLAVAGSLTDDLELARTYRRAGFTTVVRAGHEDVRCRMYDGGTDLRSGYRRWLATEFGGTTGALVVALIAAVTYIGPVVQSVTGPRRRTAGAALAMAAGSRLLARKCESGRLTAVDVVAALGHPISVAMAAALVVDSAQQTRRRTLSWKGRTLGRVT